jgi:hypothetical protein
LKAKTGRELAAPVLFTIYQKRVYKFAKNTPAAWWFRRVIMLAFLIHTPYIS